MNVELLMNIRVIIVDDHRVVREGIEMFLKLDNQIEIVAVAVNGLEGVKKTRELKPDVVLMDLMMPVMDGYEATAIIKHEMPDVKVFVLTSLSGDKNATTRALKAGADKFLIKGTDLERLNEIIKDAL